ncbi:MAG: 16S rRNA (guanine(966)-N(2))-methyltransferase RsmD [Ancalomicrobiaceae bacterium]|nr:16S rRNA (guanine(966)-N(2))-methyltransferase RsmD [Ancalomicrobiaceae bacterium]
MRIVGGRFRGAALSPPKSLAIRPTSDRLRETLFNILVHAYGDPVGDARVLDLFSGTGALGLEALSRGARFALFVEEAVEARGLIRRNIETLGLTGATKLWRRDATKLGMIEGQTPFDLVFADPPYSRGLGDTALGSAVAGGWLAPGALVVLEEAAEAEIAVPEGLELLETRDYGETKVMFMRARSPAEDAGL